MNISEFVSIIRVVLMLCAAGAVISGIMKARKASKNGHGKLLGIGAIAIGIILAILCIVLTIYLGDAADGSDEYIKAQHPLGVPNITYGQVLDAYCENQKWYRMASEASDSGQTIVQMDAECSIVTADKITIQFSYGVRDFAEIDANTPFEITFVGFDDSTETSVSVMQEVIYAMFMYYAADNAIELDRSALDTILYSSGWNVGKITSNKTETTAGTTPQESEMQDDKEYDPLFEKFSEFMYQYADFSGMSDGEIQSYLEEAYKQWIMGEAYDEIVFDENFELTLQDMNDNEYLQEDDANVEIPTDGGHIALEDYLNFDFSAEEMGESLQMSGLDFVMDESGWYRSSDESVLISNTDLGGSSIEIWPSENNLYSIFGIFCEMSVDDAWNALEEYGAVEVTSPTASMNYGASIYTLFDSYMMTIIYNEDWSKIEGITFDCYLW